MCKECQSPVDEVEKSTIGSMLVLKVYCIAGHQIVKRYSQLQMGKVPTGNILCASTNAANEEHIKEIKEELNSQEIKEELNSQETWLSGDGRLDSPGYSAKYSTYLLMAQKSQKIVASNLIHKSDCKSSSSCEKEGLMRCLNDLKQSKFNVELIATERSSSIHKFMRESKQSPIHEYGVGHVTKSVGKKINKTRPHTVP